jgi:hypothetical protein
VPAFLEDAARKRFSMGIVLQFPSRAAKSLSPPEFAGVDLNIDSEAYAHFWNEIYVTVRFALSLIQLDSARVEAGSAALLRDGPMLQELIEALNLHSEYVEAVVQIMRAGEARLRATAERIVSASPGG